MPLKAVNLAAVQNHELVQARSTSRERIKRWCDAFHIRPRWPRLNWPGHQLKIAISTGLQHTMFRRERELKMKISSMTVVAILATMSSTTLLAETGTEKFEATKTISGGSLNPPNPGDACIEAKKNVTEKAANAGYKGAVVWDHLSSDSDCKLSTTRVGTLGYYYTFTAKGTFSKTGVQASLEPQKEFKAKFKEGCKSSNGSWIENPDGSYQCNTRSGETNLCFKDTPNHPCIHKKL